MAGLGLLGTCLSIILSIRDQLNPYNLIPEEKINIWKELESNPGPRALTTGRLSQNLIGGA